VIVISGCMSIHQESMGAFQELNQVCHCQCWVTANNSCYEYQEETDEPCTTCCGLVGLS